MQTRLLFVRHGESVHTVERFVGGPRACRGLTPLGRRQASALGRRLAAELGPSPSVALYSSTLRRAIETASEIAVALGAPATQDCDLCTWHVPEYADGLPTGQFQADHGLEGGGVFRPFEDGNETWAALVARVGRAVATIAGRHRGGCAVVVGHSETVSASFHTLAMLPLYAPFDLRVAAGSLTEWVTDDNPTRWPPPRWTLVRFSDAPPVSSS